MEKEMDPRIVKATQASLGKYVKKPALTDKLLKKPPFRFLHDIITTVIKTTGFFEGLFEDSELLSDNVKDRESKITFLNKVISVLAITTGSSLDVKPSKIVAGQEPEKTNRLLQCLAQALDENLSSAEAVKHFKEGSRPTETKKISKLKNDIKSQKKSSSEDKNVTKPQINEKLAKPKKETVNKSTIKREKDTLSLKKAKQKENTTLQTSIPVDNTLKKEPEVKETESKMVNLENDNKISQKLSNSSQNDDSKTEFFMPDEEKSLNVGQKLNVSYTISDDDLNSSKSNNDLQEVESIKDEKVEQNENLASLQKVTVETVTPASSKDDLKLDNLKKSDISNTDPPNTNNDPPNTNNDPPSSNNDPNKINLALYANKFQDNQEKDVSQQKATNIRPLSVRPPSSRPGAPRPREKLDNISNNENILLGKVNIIAEISINDEEDTSIVLLDQFESGSAVISNDPEQSSNHESHLVQQILDSQKELSQIAGRTEIEWQNVNQKSKESVHKEFEQLRYNIQALSRIATPLGKLLDHIQEDVEVMRQELMHWRKTYQDTSKELAKHKMETEDLMLPFHAKIKKLNTDIEERHEKINDLKIVLHKNSTRIERLLASSNG